MMRRDDHAGSFVDWSWPSRVDHNKFFGLSDMTSTLNPQGACFYVALAVYAESFSLENHRLCG